MSWKLSSIHPGIYWNILESHFFIAVRTLLQGAMRIQSWCGMTKQERKCRKVSKRCHAGNVSATLPEFLNLSHLFVPTSRTVTHSDIGFEVA